MQADQEQTDTADRLGMEAGEMDISNKNPHWVDNWTSTELQTKRKTQTWVRYARQNRDKALQGLLKFTKIKPF